MPRIPSSSIPSLVLAFVASLSVACVSPPVDAGPSADALLEGVLLRAHKTPEGRFGRELRQLSLQNPRHVPTLLADAAISLDEQRDDRAIALLDAVLKLEPWNVDAVLLATRHAARVGDLAGAHRRLDTALRIVPDEPALYEGRASVFFVEGRHDESLRALDHADALADEESWRRAYHRGLVKESLGQLGAAEEHFARCLELAPGFEPAIRRKRSIEAMRASSAP